jgi:hypothetical protein
MNRIIREHYPAANLPEDLREGLDQDATVRVVVEVEADRPSLDPERVAALPHTLLGREETRALIGRIRGQNRPFVSAEEAVARIRELRDEWDH